MMKAIHRREIRIALIDRQLSYLQLLEMLMNQESDLSVAATATNCKSALENCRGVNPDIVLIAVEPGHRKLVDCVRALRDEHPQIKVLLMSNRIAESLVVEAHRVKAKGYLTKDESVDTIIDSIRRITSGDYCFSRGIDRQLKYDAGTHSYRIDSACKLASLSPRQQQVLQLLAEGDSVKEAAKKLQISAKSVDSHKYRIMKQLNIHDRVQLARYAIREGLVAP